MAKNRKTEQLHSDIRQRFDLAHETLSGLFQQSAARLANHNNALTAGRHQTDEIRLGREGAEREAQDAFNSYEIKRQGVLGDYLSKSEKAHYEHQDAARKEWLDREEKFQKQWDREEKRLDGLYNAERERLDGIGKERENLAALKQDYQARPDEFAQEAIEGRGRGAEANRIPAFQEAGGELAAQRFEHSREQRQQFSQAMERDGEFSRQFAAEREPLATAYAERLASLDANQSLGTQQRLDQQLQAKQEWHGARADLAETIGKRFEQRPAAAERVTQQEQQQAQRVSDARGHAGQQIEAGATPNQVRHEAGFDHAQRSSMAQRDLSENPDLAQSYKHEGVFESPRQSPDMNMAPSWAGGNNQSTSYSVEVQRKNSAERVRDGYVHDVEQDGHQQQPGQAAEAEQGQGRELPGSEHGPASKHEQEKPQAERAAEQPGAQQNESPGAQGKQEQAETSHPAQQQNRSPYMPAEQRGQERGWQHERD